MYSPLRRGRAIEEATTPKAESPGAIRVDATAAETAAAKSHNHLQRAEKRGGQKIDGVKRVCVVAVLSVVACSFCCSEEPRSAPDRRVLVSKQSRYLAKKEGRQEGVVVDGGGVGD